jgi:hypothetical protein
VAAPDAATGVATGDASCARAAAAQTNKSVMIKIVLRMFLLLPDSREGRAPAGGPRVRALRAVGVQVKGDVWSV